MHGVIFDVLRPHGLKRPRPDMESHLSLGNTRCIELLQQRLIKM